MANYPTSDPSFTTKNAGDVIQPAHVNNLQDEVVAIGSALRASVQHGLTVGSTFALTVSGGVTTLQTLQSSNSTIVNLTVSGGSTFAGPVVFSSGITFSTTVQVPTPSARVTFSANQNTASGSWTGLSWDNDDVDVYGMHSTASNSSRITFVESTGQYLVGVAVEWSVNSSANRFLRIMLNDATGVAADARTAIAGGNQPQSVSGLVRIASTSDYVTVMVNQNTGSTLSVTTSTSYPTAFWAVKVSPR